MKGIDYLREVWNVPYARDLVLVFATALITHLMELKKQKNEQKQKFKGTLGEKIAISLSSVRHVVVKTKTMEVYSENGTMPTDATKEISTRHDFAWYPAFMTNAEALLDFASRVSSLRSEHEPYLDLKSAAYLYALEDYLMSLMLYIKKNGLVDYLHLIGCFVIIDIQKWEKRVDVHLVRQINKPHYKLFSRHGIKWSVAKWYVEKTFLEKTELHKAMQGIPIAPIEAIIAAKTSEKERINV